MPVINLTIFSASFCVDIEFTKDLSILILSKFSSLSLESEEYPVPKSSIEIFTPNDLSFLRILIGMLLSLKSEDSS